jgi:peptide/nickel transport system permease protein
MRLKLFASILMLWMLTSIFGQLLSLSPDQIDLPNILATPSMENLFGNDELGRPVLDRLIMGARTSFLVALWVVLISASLGTMLGAFAAYSGGLVDLLLVRIIDIFLAFPGILLAIALAGVMGPGIENVIIALSIVGWVGFARLARAQVLSLKHRDHISAAIALGQGRIAIVRRHLLPLIIAPLIIETTFGVAGVVIAEAGLSFLGLGVQPPSASWGSMIRDGARYMLVAPHLVLAPGICIMLVVLSINMLGDRLRDSLDIKTWVE